MIPPDANAGFVAAMEDVLETYQKPRDPDRPLVCLDETSKQLIRETRAPMPAKPGQPARHDYEYERNGVANLFMMFAPLEGWRCVKVTDEGIVRIVGSKSTLEQAIAGKVVASGGVRRRVPKWRATRAKSANTYIIEIPI